MEEKRCKACGEIKSLEEFQLARAGKYGRMARCRSCVAMETRKKRVANLERFRKYARNWHRKQDRFKLALRISRKKAKEEKYNPCNATVEEVKAVFTGRCHVCGVLEEGLTRKLAMDHCHFSGRHRGWLCGKCNTALGLLGDSPKIITALAGYAEYAGVRKSA